MPRIGKESHVAQFLKLAHTGLKFDRYEQPQNVVVELNNKKNPLPLMYFICISFLRFSSSRRETFLSKIERNIVERKMRKERIEIIFAKESQESELSVTKIHPLSMELLGFFSIRTCHRFTYVHRSFLFLRFTASFLLGETCKD